MARCEIFFISLVVGLPFNQISGGSEGWLFCSVVVILMSEFFFLHLNFVSFYCDLFEGEKDG